MISTAWCVWLSPNLQGFHLITEFHFSSRLNFCLGSRRCQWKVVEMEIRKMKPVSFMIDVIHGKPCWDIQSLERCWDGKYVLLLFRWWLNIYSTSSSAYDVLPALLYTEWGEQSTAKQIHWRQANTWCVVKKHVASNTNYRWLTNPCKNM